MYVYVYAFMCVCIYTCIHYDLAPLSLDQMSPQTEVAKGSVCDSEAHLDPVGVVLLEQRYLRVLRSNVSGGAGLNAESLKSVSVS